MGRPRKGCGIDGADMRMMEAFWGQLAVMPFAKITAASVTREVGCNRATFYYHFDSIEDLACRAVEEMVPYEIVDLMLDFLDGRSAELRLDDHGRRCVERLCLLVADGGSSMLVDRFKGLLQGKWVERFGLDASREDVLVVLAFMASGVVGVLGQWAGRRCDEGFDAGLQVLGRVFSAAAISFAEQMGAAASR